MKKLISFCAVFITAATLLTAQVLPATGVRNTLSTTMGVPVGPVGSDRDGFHWYGFTDALQARVDVGPFTLEGMLNWGALTNFKATVNGHWNDGIFYPDTGVKLVGLTLVNTEQTPFYYTNGWAAGSNKTSGNAESYYVNFLWHPIKEMDVGMGTRLNWVIGPAPAYGDFLWGPLCHIVQGGLKDGTPGSVDVAGYAKYFNCYARKAIGVRYINKVVEIGASIPSGATTDSFLTDLGVKITPANWISISAAFEGIWNGASNLYTGVSMAFNKDFSLDAYLAIDNISSDTTTGIVATGCAAFFRIPKTQLTLRPEVGINFFENKDYTPAVYTGARIQFVTGAWTFGGWSSLAWGSSNKNWDAEKMNGGFILDIRPDVTYQINKRHSISAMFDYQNRTNCEKKTYDTWATSAYWSYKY